METESDFNEELDALMASAPDLFDLGETCLSGARLAALGGVSSFVQMSVYGAMYGNGKLPIAIARLVPFCESTGSGKTLALRMSPGFARALSSILRESNGVDGRWGWEAGFSSVKNMDIESMISGRVAKTGNQ
jgi:hypothetical protein